MSLSKLFKRVIKPVFGLVVVSAMIISCENVNGPGGLSAENGALALSASRAGVGVTYHIRTVQDLIDVNDDPTGDYILDNDLTLSDWVPLCDPDFEIAPFTGTFDGQGNTITVNSFDEGIVEEGKYLGIFAVLGGVADDPSVSNLNIRLGVGGVTTSAQYVGGIAAYARNTAFSNITVTGRLDVTQSPNTPANFNIGGVAGFAASSSFVNVQALDIGLNTARTVSSKPEWEIWRGDGIFHARAVIDSIVTVTGEDGLTTGGVVGYVKYSQFNDVYVTGNIDALGWTQSTPVYVGGIAGFADGTNIDDSQTNVTVRGNGPGYNTSAGGVAGYIINSRINYASASGTVTLSGTSVDFDWSYSWQVYAGGLVGYAGGSDAGPSLIDHSHASGDVSAYAPYPYAGGLVGYLYGFNDFINPAKNGSTVSRSYATGNARAEVQTDTAHEIGDVPYAGGLVGYASVTGSTIVDSYARGNAIALTNGTYAWAGGIVGGNANDAVVLRTYATGDVTSTTGSLPPLYAPDYAPAGPAAGGIAGFDYYTSKTKVEDSVALNKTISGNNSAGQDVVHRVVGSIGDGTGHDGILDDNLANENMAVGINWKPEYGANRRDGANTASVPPKSDFTALGWDFVKVWATGTDGYPILQ